MSLAATKSATAFAVFTAISRASSLSATMRIYPANSCCSLLITGTAAVEPF
jgi:hypothetical protein